VTAAASYLYRILALANLHQAGFLLLRKTPTLSICVSSSSVHRSVFRQEQGMQIARCDALYARVKVIEE
jgi:hypothetical protein